MSERGVTQGVTIGMPKLYLQFAFFFSAAPIPTAHWELEDGQASTDLGQWTAASQPPFQLRQWRRRRRLWDYSAGCGSPLDDDVAHATPITTGAPRCLSPDLTPELHGRRRRQVAICQYVCVCG